MYGVWQPRLARRLATSSHTHTPVLFSSPHGYNACWLRRTGSIDWSALQEGLLVATMQLQPGGRQHTKSPALR